MIRMKENKKIKIMIAVLIFIVVSLNADAIPVPHGVDGHVYDLDGITPASKINFYVEDKTTGESINGKTDSTGRYSVSLNGNDGNEIFVKVWNQYNQNNKTLALQGVMHNVNLLLNMSMPEKPPNITSTPLTNATVNALYYYDVEAYDLNDDILNYSLDLSPEDMTINFSTGVIKWTPTKDQTGKNNVVVDVYDGVFHVKQNFTINVIYVNHPPEITSEPVTNAYVFRKYVYMVNATDYDNDILEYSLEEKPSNMIIKNNTGLIEWTPLFRHIGMNHVVLKVSDNNSSVFQEFDITVKIKGYGPLNSYSEESDKEDETIHQASPSSLPSESKIEQTNSLIEEITTQKNKSVEFKAEEFSKRPSGIKTLEKNVYKYLKIDLMKDLNEKLIINFKVDNSWINNNKAYPNEVTLNVYSDIGWVHLNTTLTKSEEGFSYYQATSDKSGYFAVSLNKIKEIDNIVFSGPSEQYVISGTIYKNNKKSQVKETNLKITNSNNGNIIKTKTGIGNNPGAYYSIIKGKKGDVVEIEAKNLFGYENKTIVLDGDMRNIDLVFEYNSKINVFIPAILTLVLILVVLIHCLKTKKRR